jgi:hypothetical protein
VAPEFERRRGIAVPTLVIGHKRDMLHPFTDATSLVDDIPGAEFIEARSLLELRLKPERLTARIAEFLDGIDFVANRKSPRRARG